MYEIHKEKLTCCRAPLRSVVSSAAVTQIFRELTIKQTQTEADTPRAQTNTRSTNPLIRNWFKGMLTFIIIIIIYFLLWILAIWNVNPLTVSIIKIDGATFCPVGRFHHFLGSSLLNDQQQRALNNKRSRLVTLGSLVYFSSLILV